VIKSLYIDNFKALNDFSMDLDPFTVVVGNNMSGKSTVLQALDFLSNIVKEDFTVFLDRRGWKVADIKSQMQKSQKMTFACDLELMVEGEMVSVQWKIEILAYALKNMMELSREEIRVQREEGEDIILNYAQPSGGYMIDKMGKCTAFPEKLLFRSSVMKMFDLDNYPVIQALKVFFEKLESFELLSPDKMRLSSRGDTNTIGNAGEKLPSFVKSMNQIQKEDFESKIEKLLGKRIVSVDAKTKGKPGWTELITEERYGAKTMKIKSKNMSDGMLRLLAFLAICEMDPCTMLLDEIENGINLDYAEQIVHILDENCKSKNNQLIVTTHSPIFLDYVQKENIRYLYREPASGNCKCSSLAQNTELNEKLQYLYPGELFMNMCNKDIVDLLLKQEGQNRGAI
jgi:predicted ATPase